MKCAATDGIRMTLHLRFLSTTLRSVVLVYCPILLQRVTSVNGWPYTDIRTLARLEERETINFEVACSNQAGQIPFFRSQTECPRLSRHSKPYFIGLLRWFHPHRKSVALITIQYVLFLVTELVQRLVACRHDVPTLAQLEEHETINLEVACSNQAGQITLFLIY